MKIERHETGPRMSKAVIHGDTVYLAGILADSPKRKNMGEQTSNILSQIDGFLAMAGTNKTKLLSANIWITDMAQSTLHRLAHERAVAPALGTLIDALVRYGESLPYDSDDASLIRVAHREYQKKINVPPDHIARAIAHGSASCCGY
jgi:enamine deaminase RidA (YjgF/YER057c/UK114 family)